MTEPKKDTSEVDELNDMFGGPRTSTTTSTADVGDATASAVVVIEPPDLAKKADTELEAKQKAEAERDRERTMKREIKRRIRANLDAVSPEAAIEAMNKLLGLEAPLGFRPRPKSDDGVQNADVGLGWLLTGDTTPAGRLVHPSVEMYVKEVISPNLVRRISVDDDRARQAELPEDFKPTPKLLLARDLAKTTAERLAGKKVQLELAGARRPLGQDKKERKGKQDDIEAMTRRIIYYIETDLTKAIRRILELLYYPTTQVATQAGNDLIAARGVMPTFRLLYEKATDEDLPEAADVRASKLEVGLGTKGLMKKRLGQIELTLRNSLEHLDALFKKIKLNGETPQVFLESPKYEKLRLAYVKKSMQAFEEALMVIAGNRDRGQAQEALVAMLPDLDKLQMPTDLYSAFLDFLEALGVQVIIPDDDVANRRRGRQADK